MIKNYEIEVEDEKILNELDNLCGVSQNKEVLKDLITYIKLKQNNEINFGNYNIIIRNDSSYNLLNDFLKVCTKILKKYNIIENEMICYLDKIDSNRKEILDKIVEIEDSIIVINERKIRIEYADEIEKLNNVMKQCPKKVFIFEDTNFREGEADAELGELATWRMKIEKISLEDKIIYCKNKFDENNLKYKKQDLKEFADVPFWVLKNIITKLIINCKSKNIDSITKEILNENKEAIEKSKTKKESEKHDKQIEKNAKEQLNALIGLKDIKSQMEKILNYIKLNKQREKMPTLHMCFTGNPGTGKTSIARIIGKLFEEEEILSSGGNFVEIHARDLVGKYVGWTSQKVHDIVQDAIGGVLFIDEAYSLVADRRGSFEDEAIATLIKEMEDHRDEICIILAGYTDEMENLIKLNPGFESRIQFTINFPDYNEEELLSIFTDLCKKENYKLSNTCKEILINNFNNAKNSENFGNGRYARNLFEKIKFEQANRIVKTNSKFINTIIKSDVENVINSMPLNTNEKRVIGFCS